MSKYHEEILSKKWGMLTPLKFHGNDPKSRRTLWLCRCDCGKEKVIRSDSLRKTYVISCGCLNSRRGSKSPSWKGYEEISGGKWRCLQNDAKKRNLDFSISIEYAWNLFISQNKTCPISGKTIYLSAVKYNTGSTASLDRIDSSKGYVEGNIWWVHKDINIMKWDFPLDTFIENCKRIVEFQNKKNVA